MLQTLPSLRLTGATILRDGALQQRSIAFSEGRITRGPLPEVDLTGYLILPGIIDLHGDAFERHISPRPSAPFALQTGLRATDRDAAANGITTAWLAQSWSWEGGTRGPDFALSLMQALSDYRARDALTDLRLQIRCETHTVETEARLVEAVRHFGIDYVVFNDHLDEAEHMLAARPEEFHFWAKRLGRTSETHRAALLTAQRQRREVPRYLCRLAEQFDALGVTYGSHDDPDGETRETFSMIGAKICEFPTARPAAALARAVGDPILMGAPNVVRGGSQAGNIAATELIRAGLCDALVSDYYYPALAQAAFQLADDGLLPLAAAWDMISSRPAHILRLHDRGRLDPGLRADMVVIDPSTRAIEATISGGRITHLAGEAAHRFTCVPHRAAMAAE
ncbi:alpha-D-ribose 1-methylphosphonate 5-triphosphate diphosphatase [Pseudooceanicola spongiae]|uniref:Alpha-D-ribose 1-methylphosphonate 5-triphosphate diphosphatase n=1 Tax=Pseudooceanicola spongiae TaxID=2613965 RepID=A0A7L9WIT5_9RHOB|nr:alpha-D-ribose 1-methylphosphonate 5-triphosphate diphosphatase [Pseudooceanicola spongiae]QOL79627.1 alpha-D-ribose 1-methylphosphonate 5-triphosphate diphosphatase [Pseudooceanicola spongiae]